MWSLPMLGPLRGSQTTAIREPRWTAVHDVSAAADVVQHLWFRSLDSETDRATPNPPGDSVRHVASDTRPARISVIDFALLTNRHPAAQVASCRTDTGTEQQSGDITPHSAESLSG